MEQHFDDVSGMSIDYMHEMNISMVLPSCLTSYKNEPVYVVILFMYINHERHGHVVSVLFIDILHGTTFYGVYAFFLYIIFYMKLHLYNVSVLFY